MPAWNKAMTSATGNPPHPRRWLTAYPNARVWSGASGVLTPVPSTNHVQCPRHSPTVSTSDWAAVAMRSSAWQTGAGLAVGGGGERPPAQAREMGAGGVAVEELEEEQVDCGDRVAAARQAARMVAGARAMAESSPS